MALSAQHTVTNAEIDKLTNNLCNAAKNLKMACSSLRSFYTTNASSISVLVKLRRGTTNHAMVYKETALPIATVVIQNIQDFAQNYDVLEYDEFEESLYDIASEAQQNAAVATFVQQLHKELLLNFKSEQDNVDTVLNTLKLDGVWYTKQAQKLEYLSKIKFACAIGLFFVPGVNLIATPYLCAQSKVDYVNSIANQEESRLAVSATRAVEDALNKSLEKFIEALAEISGFFMLLESELNRIAQFHDQGFKRHHYLKCRKKSPEIIAACNDFIKCLPDCKTDLQVIPIDCDKNYVQEWLIAKKTQIGNQTISFSEWGKQLFVKDEQVLNLFTFNE
ncbi:1517_t:CDS:1 [Ambispora gerdemannii]|uniref:1517_t:CDS:1 n=1 Tax=Ambispora gerdemannii TaxID=144530 RepID=A0A9N9H6Q6_9GLOM|nr:1517_t:CDS:1 [Ambispora gerdemannii]